MSIQKVPFTTYLKALSYMPLENAPCCKFQYVGNKYEQSYCHFGTRDVLKKEKSKFSSSTKTTSVRNHLNNLFTLFRVFFKLTKCNLCWALKQFCLALWRVNVSVTESTCALKLFLSMRTQSECPLPCIYLKYGPIYIHKLVFSSLLYSLLYSLYIAV